MVHVPFGRRSVVILTAVVGLLSLITGILHLATPVPIGFLRPYIPTIVTDVAGFTGAMTGFVMLLSAYLLQRGFRVGWYSALLLLPISALQGLIQASVLSIPLIILSLVAIPTVAVNRSRFTRQVSLDSTQIGSAIAIIGAFAYGTFGSFATRDQFSGIDTLLDAFYYTIITATTVGYGDAVPTTQFARLFGISVVILTTASFAVFLGTLLVPAIEARFSRALGQMTASELSSLDDHLVVIGVGDLTESILTEVPTDTDVVIVAEESDRSSRLKARDYRVLFGSGTDEQTLELARVNHARAIIVATEDDAHDVLAILTARHLAPDVRIVAAASNKENISKMQNAGADQVVSPAMIGGKLLAQASVSSEEDTFSAESNDATKSGE